MSFLCLEIISILQMVWKSNKKVGFGIAIGRDWEYMANDLYTRITVADYDGGNIQRKSVYCKNVDLDDGEIILHLVLLTQNECLYHL